MRNPNKKDELREKISHILLVDRGSLEPYVGVVDDLISLTEQYGIQERKSQLDELIDINSKTFNRWTQTDIANFFLEVGRIYRSLENRLANKEKEQ